MHTKSTDAVHPVTRISDASKRKILFANIPADGHFSPLTGLAIQLKNAGHDVRWYTGASYASKIEQLGIPFYLFKKAKEVTIHNIDEVFPQRKQIKNHVKKVIFDICTYFIARGTEFYEDIKDINESFDFDILICDSAFTGMSFVKEKLHKHAVAIGILPLCESSRQLPPPIMGLTPAKTLAGSAAHAFLRFLTNRVLFKKPHTLIDEQYQRAGMSTNGKNLFDLQIDKATLFLQSGTPGFEYKRSTMSSHIHFIGPLLPYNNSKPQTLDFEDKLRQYQKVLLVTQGTFEGDVNKLIVPAIEAFKNTNYLVIATTAGWHTAVLRGRYQAFDNIIIRDFIPFNQVMPFADVFISNGGYGGVMQSICNKLPMVVAGIHEGKNEICARVGYFKVGINLRTEHPSPERIKNAVQKILSNPVYQETIGGLSAEFGRYNPSSLCELLIDQLPLHRRP
ncbi:glycosyltransferase [Niabella hirudinis]|uniref:glycosyltransferase n=1 Tax=Niabella hirudinis TaxID=1285929 RepID=UPI003EBC3318